MNPDVPEKERSPVPKRRWKPLDEPDKRTIREPTLEYVPSMPGPAYETSTAWSGH